MNGVVGNELGARRAEQFPHLGNYTLSPATTTITTANKTSSSHAIAASDIDHFHVLNCSMSFIAATNYRSIVTSHKLTQGHQWRCQWKAHVRLYVSILVHRRSQDFVCGVHFFGQKS